MLKHMLLRRLVPGKELLHEVVRRVADEHVADVEDHGVHLVPGHGLIGQVKANSLVHCILRDGIVVLFYSFPSRAFPAPSAKKKERAAQPSPPARSSRG